MKLHTIVNGPLLENCYVVYKDAKALVIDPGLDSRLILDEINKLNIKKLAIILTHGHYDHIGAVEVLSNEFDCDIYMHSNEQTVVDYSVDKFKEMSGKDIKITKEIKHFEPKMSLLCFEFEVIHTPGHSTGSVCLMFKDMNWLFTGDTLFRFECGRWDLHTGSMKQMWTSLELISKLDKKLWCYPGHYGGETIETLLKDNSYISKFAK